MHRKTASPQVRAVGLVWYSRQDYPRILEIMEDSFKLPETFDKWLRSAELGEREMKRAGHIVVRARVDPAVFREWCVSNGVKADAEGRMKWANLCAYEQVKSTH